MRSCHGISLVFALALTACQGPTSSPSPTPQPTPTPTPSVAKHLVVFVGNGGSGIMPSETVSENVPTELYPNAFAYQGYAFNGWNTRADGTGDSYPDRGLIMLANLDITLYAQWSNQTGVIWPTPTAIPQYSVTIGGASVLQFGTLATFSVTYHGSPSAYQWLLDGQGVSGANGASWSFTPTVGTVTYGQHVVSLVVSDDNGLKYSGSLTVKVGN